MPYLDPWEGNTTADSSIRVAVFAGLGAFAFSVIIAVFARIPFFVLLLRAVFSGLGFGGLVFGAAYSLKRLVPDLFGEPVSAPLPAGDSQRGGLVDIVLPAEELSGESAMASEALEQEVDSLKTEHLVPPPEGTESAASTRKPSVNADELDTLPDLDTFSDSFSDGESAPGDETPQYAGPADTMPTAAAQGGGEDPAVLAKAVQTLLRRDQKGP